MREITTGKLSKILKEHERWLENEDEGEKAALFKRSFHMKYIFSVLIAIILSGCYTSQNYSGSYSRPFNTSQSTFNQNYGGGDKMNLNTGDYLMDMGGGDLMNLNTGDYLMDMGGGDKMNLNTGDYLMDMGGGDLMNLDTGDYLMDMD